MFSGAEALHAEGGLRGAGSALFHGRVGNLFITANSRFLAALGMTNFVCKNNLERDGDGPVLPLRHNASSFGQQFADPANLRADAFEFLFNLLVAAVDVVDAVDNRLAIGNQRGQHQRS